MAFWVPSVNGPQETLKNNANEKRKKEKGNQTRGVYIQGWGQGEVGTKCERYWVKR